MLGAVRERVSGLSKETKQIILRATMLVVLGVSLLGIVWGSAEAQASETSAFEGVLKEYVGRYGGSQEQFNRFVFYVMQDNVIFSEKQLNENFYEEINSFANLTEADFQELYHIVTSIAKARSFLEVAEFEDNYYYDWADFLPPPKNMRDADVSHVFAVVAAMEFEVNKRLALVERSFNRTVEAGDWVTLSEQEVIDCCANCLLHPSPKYVYTHLANYGASLEQNYPYKSAIYAPGPFHCDTAHSSKPYHIQEYYQLTGCRELAERLEEGPIVVAVDSRGWHNYEGGVFECMQTVRRNHYVLLVGRGIGYWKIRNSWGPRWGEHGYMRIKFGNSCGICGRGSYPQLK